MIFITHLSTFKSCGNWGKLWRKIKKKPGRSFASPEVFHKVGREKDGGGCGGGGQREGTEEGRERGREGDGGRYRETLR